MIDTIFYFCPTLELYEQTLTENGGEGISSRTITFVEDVREIYFNGRGYGKTSTAGLVSEDEFNAWKNAILGRLGSIDDKLTEHDSALDDVLSKFLEALSDIDDINTYIEDLLTRITNTNTKLQEEIDGLSNKINQEVLNQLEDADSLINQALDGKMETAIGDGLNAYQGFVTTDNATWADLVLTYNNIKSTVNQVGYLLDDNGNIKYTSAIQSLINQGIENNLAFLDLSTRYAWLDDEENVIKWMTSGFKSRTGEASSFAELFAAAQSGIDADALASLKTEIFKDADDRYVAEGDFSTRVSGFLTSDDLNGYALVESLSSLALKSTMEEASASLMASYGINDKTTIAGINATANENWARISAITSRDGNNAVIFNLSMLDSAVAGLIVDTNSTSYAKIQAATTTDESGVDITTIVNGAMSSYALKTYVDAAETRIRNYLTDGNGNVITSSSLQSQVDRNAAKLDAIANWSDWESNQPVRYTSLWVLQANLEGAVAGLIASGSNNLKAAITAYVNSNDSGITLSADHINLDGDVIATRLTSANATIGGFRIYNGYLWAESGNNRLLLSASSGITFSTVGENTSSVLLSMDGSGHLAKGNISWTTAGAVTMTGATVDSATITNATISTGLIGGFSIDNLTLNSTTGNQRVTLRPHTGIEVGYGDGYWTMHTGMVDTTGSSGYTTIPSILYLKKKSNSDIYAPLLTIAATSEFANGALIFNGENSYYGPRVWVVSSADHTDTIRAYVDNNGACLQSSNWMSKSNASTGCTYVDDWGGVKVYGSDTFSMVNIKTSGYFWLPVGAPNGTMFFMKNAKANAVSEIGDYIEHCSSGDHYSEWESGENSTIIVKMGTNRWVAFYCG